MTATKSGRLSVTTAREHVEDGHGGEYEPYCYRCQYFDEVRNSAGWQLLAIEKQRVWLSPEWPHWTRLVGIGTDEYWRYTVWLGPLVIALRRCRDSVAREYIARLRETADSDLGQVDRDKQRVTE